MLEKYYFDTSIWIDLIENRKGFDNEPIGNYALKLFAVIKLRKDELYISDVTVKELRKFYDAEEINSMILPFEKIIRKIYSSEEQRLSARIIARQRNVPSADVLHAILARDHTLKLITRDNDFRQLKDISDYYKPEDIV